MKTIANCVSSVAPEAAANVGTTHSFRVTYISWAESCSRSDHTARELGGRSYMVYLPKLGSRPATIALKYLGQWIKTSRILRAERPDAVFVMTPPVFAALPALWYAWRHNKPFVLDAHTAAFLHPRWRHLQSFQRALCRRAATTLVHNAHLANEVRRAGGHATLVPDVPVIFENVEPFDRPPAFCVGVVCSFNPDEPIDAVFGAARLLSDVRFFITGDPCHLPAALRSAVPENVSLTGFLSTPAYGGLLAGVDAVLTLTTRDHTMLRGAYEAIYQGTPVIVSNSAVLREAFDDGTVHVDNSAGAIAAGIVAIQSHTSAYRAGASRLRAAKLARWQTVREDIVARLHAVARPERPLL